MNPIKHVAIIMDGNGRWGIKNKGSRNKGHTEPLLTLSIDRRGIQYVPQNRQEIITVRFG